MKCRRCFTGANDKSGQQCNQACQPIDWNWQGIRSIALQAETSSPVKCGSTCASDKAAPRLFGVAIFLTMRCWHDKDAWNEPFQDLDQGGVLAGRTKRGLQESLDWITAQGVVANQRGLQLSAYEGGQHLAGHSGVENNQAITNLFITANGDPRMGELYATHLNQWKQAGGGLFMNFVDVVPLSKWGSWGSREDQTQTSTPKHDALMNFIDANPKWWQ
jgi:hypothetical protein